MKTQQASPRFKKRLSCDLEFAGHRHPGLVLNLSRSGLFVQTSLRARPGSVIGVNLNSPQYDDPIELHTRVVWKRVVSQAMRGVQHGGVGLVIDVDSPAFAGLVGDIEAIQQERSSGADRPASSRPAPTQAVRAEQPGATPSWRVRVGMEGSPRSRSFEISAASADEAATKALGQLDADWMVIEVAELDSSS